MGARGHGHRLSTFWQRQSCTAENKRQLALPHHASTPTGSAENFSNSAVRGLAKPSIVRGDSSFGHRRSGSHISVRLECVQGNRRSPFDEYFWPAHYLVCIGGFGRCWTGLAKIGAPRQSALFKMASTSCRSLCGRGLGHFVRTVQWLGFAGATHRHHALGGGMLAMARCILALALDLGRSIGCSCILGSVGFDAGWILVEFCGGWDFAHHGCSR